MDDDVVDDDRDTAIEVQTNFCFITNLLRHHDDHKHVVFPLFFQYFSIIFPLFSHCRGVEWYRVVEPAFVVAKRCHHSQYGAPVGKKTPTLTHRNAVHAGKGMPAFTM